MRIQHLSLNFAILVFRSETKSEDRMSTTKHPREEPSVVLERMRNRIRGGNRLLLDRLDSDELAAVQSLIFSEEVEIISEACKPFVVAKLDRIVIP